MDHDFDAIILGMGPGGEVAASQLIDAGLNVAVVERELIGGECGYWACIPSKTLLRPAEARSEADRAAGVGGAALDWQEASDYRDTMIRHLDDTKQVDGYADQGATVVKEAGRAIGPGRILAGDRELTAKHIVVATGTVPVLPELPGIDDITAWTNRETYTATTLPARAIVVGGSAVGVETATFLSRFGVEVTLVHRGGALLGREEPRVGELALEYLRDAGVRVILEASASGARRDGGESVLELERSGGSGKFGDDGDARVAADVVVFATGRKANTADLGLESLGVELGTKGDVVVDSRCRAADGVWAVGDVTGVMPFTHVAKYQARVATENILGRDREATYGGIPRVVFGIPEIAAVGMTGRQARDRGLNVQSVELDAAAALARPWTYERDPKAVLGLLADMERKVLVGAWAVGPQAGEWIHYAALAVRAELPISLLRDQVAQFPTFHEAYLAALDKFAF
ncbi:dihydrolipoyl dehydrogenase family protein [Arthrobacter sp. KK5.5]|uniref:dihydrolipoyl dehydrogenase family protein n=1 Tax=Arthrobacter sp. KK5.5 TaxID=3373084 RepID=UPI003EE50413